MTPAILIQTALQSLWYRKGRSALTILGIVVGIAAVIATMGIGTGARIKIQERMSSMGKNLLEVIAWVPPSLSKNTSQKRKKLLHLRVTDAEALKKQVPLITKISPVYQGIEAPISYEGKHITGKVRGGNEQLIAIDALTIVRGSNFTAEHITQSRAVIILGARIAYEFFGNSDPIGKKVDFFKRRFTVIGVVAPIEFPQPMQNPDMNCIIPYTTMKNRITYRKNNVIDYIAMSTADKESIPTAMRQTKAIMRHRHKLKPKEGDDFTVFDQQSYAKAAEGASEIIQLLLLIIASISLLVGSIGVMNTMLVTVSERTQEIGIRLALGATTGMIRAQFLVESVILCLIGGTVGIALGIGLSHIAGRFTDWRIVIESNAIIASFLTTVIIGIFFGLYPAQRAAKLDPVDALRER